MSVVENAVFGPGTYYIGDLCYVLKDKIYDKVWGKKYNYENGVFEVPGLGSFAVANTAWGDGEYQDDWGDDYPVDAGIIGVVPESMWKVKREAINFGKVVDVKDKLTFSAVNGLFKITFDEKEIVIDTRGEEKEEEEE